MIKAGDLVRPNVSCAGALGSVRCEVAFVIEQTNLADHIPAPMTKILCGCGIHEDYTFNYEKIEKKDSK